jgi:hypothetical protein
MTARRPPAHPRCACVVYAEHVTMADVVCVQAQATQQPVSGAKLPPDKLSQRLQHDWVRRK